MTRFLQPWAIYCPSAKDLDKQRPAVPIPHTPALGAVKACWQYCCTSSSHSSATCALSTLHFAQQVAKSDADGEQKTNKTMEYASCHKLLPGIADL